MSVTTDHNSSSQDYTHSDDQTLLLQKQKITFPYKRNEFTKQIALLPLDRHFAGFLKFVVFFQPGESKITDLHQVLPHNQDIPCSKVSVK